MVAMFKKQMTELTRTFKGQPLVADGTVLERQEGTMKVDVWLNNKLVFSVELMVRDFRGVGEAVPFRSKSKGQAWEETAYMLFGRNSGGPPGIIALFDNIDGVDMSALCNVGLLSACLDIVLRVQRDIFLGMEADYLAFYGNSALFVNDRQFKALCRAEQVECIRCVDSPWHGEGHYIAICRAVKK